MSKNVKLGDDILTGVDTVELEDADSANTYVAFTLPQQMPQLNPIKYNQGSIITAVIELMDWSKGNGTFADYYDLYNSDTNELIGSYSAEGVHGSGEKLDVNAETFNLPLGSYNVKAKARGTGMRTSEFGSANNITVNSITSNLSHVTATNSRTKYTAEKPFTIKYTAESNYTLPETITVVNGQHTTTLTDGVEKDLSGNAKVDSSCPSAKYDRTLGELTIKPGYWDRDNLTINVTAEQSAARKVTIASNFSYSSVYSSPILTTDTGVTINLSSSSIKGATYENVKTLTVSGVSDYSAYIDYTVNGESRSWDCTSMTTLTLTGDITITSAAFRCLTGDTLITMHDGSQKQIKDIVAGEKVLSYNPETMLLEPDVVVYSDGNLNKSYCKYTIHTLSDGTEIKTVHRHRFYNVEKQAMVYMDEWNIGEHFIKIDGTTPYLVSSREVKEEINHYTIFTEHQNYFANGMLSGNRHTKQMNLK